MHCDECTRETASVFLTQIIHGVTTRRHLCESCARPILSRTPALPWKSALNLLLLARQYDTGPTNLTPLLAHSLRTAGTSVYNITAEFIAPERTGAVLVTRWGEGTAASRDYVYIRGSKRGFERFTPKRTTK